MYFVILWSIEGTRLEGPFADDETARSWLEDFEPTNEDHGAVIGPIPSTFNREFV